VFWGIVATLVFVNASPNSNLSSSSQVVKETTFTALTQAKTFFTSGINKQNQGDNQAAITDYDQAINLNPEYANAYCKREIDHSDLGDKKGAVADYNQAIKFDPSYADAYYSRGKARSDLGDRPGAIADFQKAIELYQQQGNSKERLQEAVSQLKALRS
jgi:tetratricopeptide (TPR) repeat protein